MTKNENWKQELEKRIDTYFDYLSDEYMTRSVYEWNCAFLSEYDRLVGWRNEDGTMRYTSDKIAEELGFDHDFDRLWEFRSNVRRQMLAYKEKRVLELHEAGKTDEEIAEELTVSDIEMTARAVGRMIERLLG